MKGGVYRMLTIILIPLLYPFMNGTPAVIAFLGTYTHKTAGTPGVFPHV